MTECRFLQIHYLTSYPASLLNRDDAGYAKRIPFGNADRVRISSQCLKRHWRKHWKEEEEEFLKEIGWEPSVRSRRIFEEKIARPLIQEGLDEETVRAVLENFQREILAGREETEREQGGDETTAPEEEDVEEKEEKLVTSKQVIVLGVPEIEYIKKTAREIVRSSKDAEDAKSKTNLKKKKGLLSLEEHKKVLKALGKAQGFDAALFGRMVTSDILARGDGAVHVAHPFTVHDIQAETDYFSAVDELVLEAGELGAGHIDVTELTSGVFYGYVVVDVRELIKNLSDDQETAARATEKLIETIATVSPGAKRGSTAPYSHAELVLIEAGTRQPRSLANAFRNATDPVLTTAIRALGDHLKAFDRMYGQEEERRIAAMEDVAEIPAEKVQMLGDLARWAGKQIRGG
ncbi:MAG: type I-E CRISPR-associated protein Cas7/Cse4/CasC [Dehalococcoidia bacterium]|nr:type I-E CRISPR-associated protein Cas7/Cse4/CasC [Dehalococcoidia bacterium]